jgi:hypothetical protein
MQQPAADNGDNGNPASSSTSPAPAASSTLPAQAPVQQDLPAPSSSVLGNPPQQPQQQQGQGGFQTVPDAGQQNQGGQL